ncbi:MAG: exopolysaccharide biosynthesis protein [Shinella sp.]|nr:exopolysaccharide biosynthesis protein [Shinella sp.]
MDKPIGRKEKKQERARRRFSEILTDLAEDRQRERISVADIFSAMGDRAFGALMLIFALPNIIPTPPGTSAILGAPLIFLSAQLMLGMKPWLPAVIAKRSMAREDFAGLILRLAPWISRAERLLKPRLTYLVHPPAEYAVGFFCLVLAVILFLPVPLGNILPALAICIFSFGILERDGLWIIAGLVNTVVALLVIASVIVGAVMAFMLVVQRVFM